MSRVRGMSTWYRMVVLLQCVHHGSMKLAPGQTTMCHFCEDSWTIWSTNIADIIGLFADLPLKYYHNWFIHYQSPLHRIHLQCSSSEVLNYHHRQAIVEHWHSSVKRYQHLYTASQKNDTDVVHYNFKAHQPISLIFGTDIAEWVRYQMVICYPTTPNECLYTTWQNMNPKIGSLQSCCILKTTLHWLAISSTIMNQF